MTTVALGVFMFTFVIVSLVAFLMVARSKLVATGAVSIVVNDDASNALATVAGGTLLGTLAAEKGFDVLRLRPFNQLGAGQRDQFVASSFARQIAQIAAGRIQPIMRVGNLESVRDFIDVEDVIGAYVQLLDASVPAAVYNIASGLGVTVQTVLDLLIELGEVEVRVETDPARIRPTDHMVGNPQRLHSAIGWGASTALRTSLASVLGYWREHLDD